MLSHDEEPLKGGEEPKLMFQTHLALYSVSV